MCKARLYTLHGARFPRDRYLSSQLCLGLVPIGQPDNRSISQSVNQPIGRSDNRSLRQSVNQPIGQPDNRSIRQSVNHTIGQSANRSISESVNKPIGQPADRSTNHPSTIRSRPIHQSAKPANEICQKTALLPLDRQQKLPFFALTDTKPLGFSVGRSALTPLTAHVFPCLTCLLP